MTPYIIGGMMTGDSSCFLVSQAAPDCSPGEVAGEKVKRWEVEYVKSREKGVRRDEA